MRLTQRTVNKRSIEDAIEKKNTGLHFCGNLIFCVLVTALVLLRDTMAKATYGRACLTESLITVSVRPLLYGEGSDSRQAWREGRN